MRGRPDRRWVVKDSPEGKAADGTKQSKCMDRWFLLPPSQMEMPEEGVNADGDDAERPTLLSRYVGRAR